MLTQEQLYFHQDIIYQIVLQYLFIVFQNLIEISHLFKGPRHPDIQGRGWSQRYLWSGGIPSWDRDHLPMHCLYHGREDDMETHLWAGELGWQEFQLWWVFVRIISQILIWWQNWLNKTCFVYIEQQRSDNTHIQPF